MELPPEFVDAVRAHSTEPEIVQITKCAITAMNQVKDRKIVMIISLWLLDKDIEDTQMKF